MTIDQVLISVSPGETRVALLEGDRLADLLVTHPGMQDVAGDIFLGRVERVLPGIQAAFVDIGTGRSGFLALADVRPAGGGPAEDQGAPGISDFLGEGDTVRVQALNDPRDDKGARLSTYISLPGRYLVATPDQAGVKVSRKIGVGEDQERLRGMVEDLCDPGEGYILRTAAMQADRDGLVRDIAYLRAVWRDITAKEAKAPKPPALLYRELEPLRRILRDEPAAGLERILIDDGETLAKARAFCGDLAPDAAGRLEEYRGGEAMFEAFGIEEQLETALGPTVALPSGGSIVIGQTAALCAIDVNTGGHTEGGPEETAMRTNLDAVPVIARQLRLRNISGLIVVDFVSMRRRNNGAAVVKALRAATADDSSPVHVAGLTRLGLVEMTRQRRRASLADILLAACPACAGTGLIKAPATVAFAVLRQVLREAASRPGVAFTVSASPPVIDVLRGSAKAAVAMVERRLGRPLGMAAVDHLAPDEADISAIQRGSGNG